RRIAPAVAVLTDLSKKFLIERHDFLAHHARDLLMNRLQPLGHAERHFVSTAHVSSPSLAPPSPRQAQLTTIEAKWSLSACVSSGRGAYQKIGEFSVMNINWLAMLTSSKSKSPASRAAMITLRNRSP